MKIWVISDTHFGHSMLVKNGYRQEGFENVIIKNWNQRVNPLDTVIHVGDFCLGKYQNYSISESIMKWRGLLAGNIILIRGNHDKESMQWYMSHGFQFCCDRLEVKYRGKGLIFTHEPLWIEDNSPNIINIHGHIHSELRNNELGFNIIGQRYRRYRNVTVDHLGFVPISLDELIK